MKRIFLCVFWCFPIFVSLSSGSVCASYEYIITFLSKPPEVSPQWICNRVDKETGDAIEEEIDSCLEKMKFELPSLYTSKDVDPELRRSIRVDISQNVYVSYPHLKTIFPNGDIIVVDLENSKEVERVYVNNFSYILGYPGNFNELLISIKKHNLEHQRPRLYKSSEGLSKYLVHKPVKQVSAPGPSYKNSFILEKEKLSLEHLQSEKSRGKEEEKEEEEVKKYLSPEQWLAAYTECFIEREAKAWMSEVKSQAYNEDIFKIQPVFPYPMESNYKFFKALKIHLEKELKEDHKTLFLTLLQILQNELHKIRDHEVFFRDESISSILVRFAQKSVDLSDFESLEASSVKTVMQKLVSLLGTNEKQEQYRDLFKIYAVIFDAYYSLIHEEAWGLDYAMKFTINVFFTRLISPILVMKANAKMKENLKGSIEDKDRVRRLQSTFALSEKDWLDSKVQYKGLRKKIVENMSRNILQLCPNL